MRGKILENSLIGIVLKHDNIVYGIKKQTDFRWLLGIIYSLRTFKLFKGGKMR